MRWRIFYADGSTFGHEDGKPEESPTHGVVVIVNETDAAIQVIHQIDFYWWRDWWRGGDIFGFIDQSARYGATWVRQGETIKFEEYQAILGEAVLLKEKWDS